MLTELENNLKEEIPMGKTKIGSMKQKILVQGDINLLEPNEILVT